MKTEVTCVLVHGQSTEGRTITLQVTDERSRIRILEVALTANQLADMLASRHSSDHPTAEVRGLSKVGRYLHSKMHTVPCRPEDSRSAGATRPKWVEEYLDNLDIEAGKTAYEAKEHDSWEVSQCRRTNQQQWVVIQTRYMPEPPAETAPKLAPKKAGPNVRKPKLPAPPVAVAAPGGRPGKGTVRGELGPVGLVGDAKTSGGTKAG